MLRRNFLSLGAFLATAVAGSRAAVAQGSPAGGAMKLTAEDYAEIQQLYARYCHALDTAKAEMFAACFTADGEFTGGRPKGHAADVRVPTKGTEALLKMGSRGGTRHFNSNLMITPTATGAKGNVYLYLMNGRSGEFVLQETGIYDDTLVKTPAGWKFAKRIVWRNDDDISPFKYTGPIQAAPQTPAKS